MISLPLLSGSLSTCAESSRRFSRVKLGNYHYTINDNTTVLMVTSLTSRGLSAVYALTLQSHLEMPPLSKAHPSKKFLDKIPAQDLAQLAQDLPKILPKVPRLWPANFWPRSWPRSYPRYGKISASWQDLGLLPRSCSSWQEPCPRTFCWAW